VESAEYLRRSQVAQMRSAEVLHWRTLNLPGTHCLHGTQMPSCPKDPFGQVEQTMLRTALHGSSTFAYREHLPQAAQTVPFANVTPLMQAWHATFLVALQRVTVRFPSGQVAHGTHSRPVVLKRPCGHTTQAERLVDNTVPAEHCWQRALEPFRHGAASACPRAGEQVLHAAQPVLVANVPARQLVQIEFCVAEQACTKTWPSVVLHLRQAVHAVPRASEKYSLPQRTHAVWFALGCHVREHTRQTVPLLKRPAAQALHLRRAASGTRPWPHDLQVEVALTTLTICAAPHDRQRTSVTFVHAPI